MKKIVWMIINIAVLLGLLYTATKVHSFVYLQPSLREYKRFLAHNPGMHLGIISVFILTLLTIFLRIKAAIRKDKGLRLYPTCQFHKITFPQVLFLFGMGLAGCLFSVGLIDIDLVAKTFPSIPNMVTDLMKADSFLYVLIGAGILGPAFEEILFRGLIFNQLRSALPLWLALLVQAMIYAYFQPSHIISLISLGSGLIYGMLYVRMNSIWAPIIMQTTAMSTIFIAKYAGFYDMLRAIGQPALCAVTIASFLLLVLGTLLIWKKGKDPLPEKAAITTTP